MGIGFGGAARRYWLRVFPAVAREVRRRREHALEIPDLDLRALAIESLESKRCNLEGAAAFELLAGKASSEALLRTLTAAQTMCDYLDLVSEQPVADPIANGRCLHEALIVACSPGERHRDYYACNSRSEDGGYLRALVRDVRRGLADLPGLAHVAERLSAAAERVALYQTFNHGDSHGSYTSFERWAAVQQAPGSAGLRWWEMGAAAGSTLCLFALIASAADPCLRPETVASVEATYFPWIGALHSMLDSVVDLDDDIAAGERGLVGCYSSAEHAAVRIDAIASEALRRAATLPTARRHTLILIAMTGFYLCDARISTSPYARAVAPMLRRTVGSMVAPATWMMAARHACRSSARPDRLRALSPRCTRFRPDCPAPR